MILTVSFRERHFYPENSFEVEQAITDIVESSAPEQQPWISPGQLACFSYGAQKINGSLGMRQDSYLRIAVNPVTRFGGLTWFVQDTWRGRSGSDITEHIWVSDNTNPPSDDPRVVSDMCQPWFYDPRSTLPIDQVIAAIREYAREGTGDRPECVSWVLGGFDGKRFDQSDER